MKKQALITTISVGLISLGLTGTANAALVGRLAATPGGTDYQAYYDEDADLTWLADANAAGAMNWVNANNWAANLEIDGVTGWRLPTTMQPDATCSFQRNLGASFPLQGSGTGCTGSEMGNLFYNVLGGVANTSITDTHNANFDLFSNVQVQAGLYWSGTEFAPDTELAWSFITDDGRQGFGSKANPHFAWAVQSGDVSTVPVPAAVWLFGSGLIGLLGLARRKRA